jgi:structural maintenance of chromosome 2
VSVRAFSWLRQVSLALSLVGYPEEVDAAMSYVFGSTFVCADADAAKNVAFNKVRLPLE